MVLSMNLAWCVCLAVVLNSCQGNLLLSSTTTSCFVSPLRTRQRGACMETLPLQKATGLNCGLRCISATGRSSTKRQSDRCCQALSAHAAPSAASDTAEIRKKDVVGPLASTSSHAVVHPDFDLMLSPGSLLLSVTLVPLLVLCVVTFGQWWRYYMAGGICACLSHALATPIDVIKTRQQIDFHEAHGQKGFMKTAFSIVRKDGLQTLLAGLGPTTVGYLLEGAAKFGTYEMLKPYIKSALTFFFAASAPSFLFWGGEDSRMMVYVISAAISGLAASAILCPMESLRIRLVAEPDFAGHKGWIHSFVTMLREEGLGDNSGLLKGMTAVTAKQIPYTITKQVSFDIIATMLYQRVRAVCGSAAAESSARIKLMIPLLAAFSASVLSCVASQPGDMLLSVVTAHEGKKRTRDFAKEILQTDGWTGFFVGIKARFLHVGAIVTVQLLIYDVVKRLCGIAATGS